MKKYFTDWLGKKGKGRITVGEGEKDKKTSRGRRKKKQFWGGVVVSSDFGKDDQKLPHLAGAKGENLNTKMESQPRGRS